MRISDWSSDVCSSDLLVLALGTGLDPRETVGDGVVDGLIVAGLEVQEAEASERAPVASVEGVGGFQVQGAGNELALIVRHHQHGPVGEALAEQVEEVAGEVRLAPLAVRSEEHTSELQSLMRISYAVFCLKHKNKK